MIKKMQKNSKCPLSDPNMGIISEQDHFNNQCICFLCTCGQHRCPRLGAKVSPLSVYESQYKQNYKSFKTPPRPSRPTYGTHRVRGEKMDLTTSHMSHYQEYKIQSKNEKPRPQSTGHSSRFVGSSQYKSEYLNWGPNQVVHNKRPVHPTHSTNIKFSQNTTYSSYFYPKEPTANTPIKNKQSLGGQKTPVGGVYVSTSQRDFRGHQSEVNINVKRRVEQYEPVVFATSQYSSHSKKAFEVGHSPVIDPHRLRRTAGMK